MDGTKFVGAVALEDLWSAAHLVAAGCRPRATFELWADRLPDDTGFLVAAGLDPLLATLEGFSLDRWISEEDLRTLLRGAVGDDVVAKLRDLRFVGEVDALPEGTVAFAKEPLLRVRCEAATGILLSSFVRSSFAAASSVATRMALYHRAAAGRPVFDVGLRSAATAFEAAQLARAAFIGGAASSHCVSFALQGGLASTTPISLRWVLHFGDREDVRARLMSLSRSAAVRIDTDDPAQGLHQLVLLGVPVQDVLLDCADLDSASRSVRRILDDAGWSRTRIHVGGDLRPSDIAAFVSTDAPIDGFFVGESVDVAAEPPALRLEFEVVEWEQEELMRPYGRTTPGRVVEAGAKMIYRRRERGHCRGDVVQRADQAPPSGAVPLLVPLWRGEGRLAGSPSIGELQMLAQSQLQQFSAEVIEGREKYEVQWVPPVAVEPMDGADLEYFEEPEPVEEPAPRTVYSRADVMRSVDDSADFSSFSSAFDSLVAERIQGSGGSPEAGDEPVEPLEDEAPASSNPLDRFPVPIPGPSIRPARPATDASETPLRSVRSSGTVLTPRSVPRTEKNARPADPPPTASRDVAAVKEMPAPTMLDVVEEPVVDPAPAAQAPPEVRPPEVRSPVVEPVRATNKAPSTPAHEPFSEADSTVQRPASPLLAAAAALKRARAPETAPLAPNAESRQDEASGPASIPSKSESEVKAKADPLLAAAARLRKVKNGEAAEPAANPVVESPDASASTTRSADPLAAAASRLKALQRGSSEPAPSVQDSASAGTSGDEDSDLEARARRTEEERVTRTKADPLLGAAGRLKALRSKS